MTDKVQASERESKGSGSPFLFRFARRPSPSIPNAEKRTATIITEVRRETTDEQ